MSLNPFPPPSSGPWTNPTDAPLATSISVWPLDIHNLSLLNNVCPKDYTNPTPHESYDIIAIGSGAGGLVTSKQSARRNAKSAMISGHLAGGDCLNVGCVPSKALIRCAKLAQEVRKAAAADSEYGILINSNGGKAQDSDSKSKIDVSIDFPAVMTRMRRLRAKIAPIDSHESTSASGAHVFQGHGKFLSANTVEVTSLDGKDTKVLKFKKCVIATGGRATLPSNIKGLSESTPYTTNATLFNLTALPQKMVVLGAGVVSLEMAQSFASFGTDVTVVQRSGEILSKEDREAAKVIRSNLEHDGVKFILNSKISEVVTKSVGNLNTQNGTTFPEMSVQGSYIDAEGSNKSFSLDCQVLLVAMGRSPNVKSINCELANVAFDKGGILVDDYGRSTSNPNVFSVGDCTSGVPRLTHMAGEMAKMVVNNALELGGDDADKNWTISSMPIPSCMYTEPELASVGISSEYDEKGVLREDVEVWKAGLLHNDRCILEGSNDIGGFCKIITSKAKPGIILGATIVSGRAGDQINEITLAMKFGITLKGIGRSVHCYPTESEAVMGCGIGFVNSSWKKL